MKLDYDMIVIGGGAGGLTAAGMSAVLGAKTALISAGKLGGDCTWTGCIPSKTLLKAAKVAHEIRTATKYGLKAIDGAHDWADIRRHVHSVRERVYEDADAPPNMEKLGVEVISTKARFKDRHSVEFLQDGVTRTLTSRYFVIATGSRPRAPHITGANTFRLLTNENLFELDRLPSRLLILGAGPVGVEMAQAFQRIGSQVTLANRSARILARDDAELAGMLTERLRDEGIRLMLGLEIERIEPTVAYFKSGERADFDEVLVAMGRQPTIENLGLENIGVKATEAGITVDRHYRTTARNIFACGDITGRYLFTHMAEHSAKVAVTNAILHLPASIDERGISWCTFTDPQLAHVGAGEEELKKRGERFHVYRFPFTKLDRAITEAETWGLIKVFATPGGKILGSSILGANAGEMIAEYALAIRSNIGLAKISSAIHPYPTFAQGNRKTADLFATRLLTPNRVRWIKRLLRLRGDTRGAAILNESTR